MQLHEDRHQEQDTGAERGVPGATPRRELTDLQAQLLALAITIGITALFVLVFGLLTGSI